MKTSFPFTILELSPDEAVCVYYDVKRSIEYTIDTHWVNHPASFEQLEAMRLQILMQLHRSVGHDVDPLKGLRDRLEAAVKAKLKP